jgi:hypothetical protein
MEVVFITRESNGLFKLRHVTESAIEIEGATMVAALQRFLGTGLEG